MARSLEAFGSAIDYTLLKLSTKDGNFEMKTKVPAALLIVR